MKTIKQVNPAFIALVTLFILLIGCRPATAQNSGNASTTEVPGANTRTPQNSATETVPVASLADDLKNLEKLGFQVFPEGQPLSAFSVVALDGSSLTQTGLEGTITLFNFWATWCPPCRQEMPSIQKLDTLMKGTAFRIVAISVGEDRRTVTSFLNTNRYTFPVYLDTRGQVGAMYASQGIPTTYILDKKGRIIAGTIGSREYSSPELVAVLKSLAAK